MRAPNGQGCSLAHDKEVSLVLVCDVLARCSQELEAAAFNKALLCFTLTNFDAVMLMETYERSAINTSGQLRLFLNEALLKLRMPYKITTVMAAFGSRNFYCHVERAKRKLGTL